MTHTEKILIPYLIKAIFFRLKRNCHAVETIRALRMIEKYIGARVFHWLTVFYYYHYFLINTNYFHRAEGTEPYQYC